MKETRCAIRTIGIIILIGFVFHLNGCYQAKEKAYYSDKNNYICGDAVVDNIIFDEENHRLYFWLSEIDDAYQDCTFKVEGKSVDVLIGSSLLEKIDIGSKITFISAPRYFGDGYCMPIVALSYNGDELLSFNVGYENLLELY